MSRFLTKPIPVDPPTTQHVVRPWGQFWQYAHNQETTVSLMEVQPGQRLSLQSHTGRAELWVVLDEGACVEIGNQTHYPSPGATLWIAAGEKHRLSCIGDQPVRVLEVAFGNWQQEDIQRYQDDYARPEQGE